MKFLTALVSSIFLTAQAQEQAEVSCLTERRNSCSVCPVVLGETLSHDFTLCAGDCQVQGEGESRVCVPKGVNCGERRESECRRCPIIDGDSMRQDLTKCQGDCEVNQVSVDNHYVPFCSLKTNSTEMPTSAETSATSSNTNQNSEEEATSVLASVKMEITNPNSYSYPPIFSFFAEVCVESRCCTTGVLRKRSGVFTFSENFRNLGNCGQLRREQNEGVTIKARTMEQTDLQIMKMEVQFDDGTLMVAENPRSYWRWRRTPLAWGVAKDMTESSQRVGRRIALPESQCPEDVSPSSNACPKANVRVHARLPDAPKFCYYQVCETFSSDLSLVGTGELGTGGYCVPEHQMKPQYQYCCDLQQYFTTLEEEPRPSQDIAFPRCNIMNYTRTDI